MEHILHYPSASEWMWSYCTYIGSYTDSYGFHYDLGFVKSEWSDDKVRFSKAIVYGERIGQYVSGEIDPERIEKDTEIAKELYRRMVQLRII